MTVPARPFPNTALAAAIGLLLGCAFAGQVLAQEDDEYEGKPRSSTMSGSASAAAERARQRKAQAANPAQPEMFPQATRKPPEKKVSQKEAKTANEIQADFDANKFADVIAKVDAFLPTSQNAYLNSYFAQLAASAELKLGDKAKAADYYLKTMQANGLDNNGHYQIMFNLAVTLNEVEREAEALTWIDRYLDETKNESEQALGLKAYVLSKLDRAADGAAVYEKLIAAHPGDRKIMMNAVSLYQQAGQDDKANALLENARKQGLLQSENEFRALFIGYVNADKYKEAEDVLVDGVGKGVLKPSDDLANDYTLIAQNYLAQDKVPQAVDFYGRAAKVATSGSAYLNLAKVLRNENRVADAKAAAREAVAKGLKTDKEKKEANAILALAGK